MIVRRGVGTACLRMRIASMIATAPVPLSSAPSEPSHESKWPPRITYSSGSALPGMTAKALKTGTSPRKRACASTRSIGP